MPKFFRRIMARWANHREEPPFMLRRCEKTGCTNHAEHHYLVTGTQTQNTEQRRSLCEACAALLGIGHIVKLIEEKE